MEMTQVLISTRFEDAEIIERICIGKLKATVVRLIGRTSDRYAVCDSELKARIGSVCLTKEESIDTAIMNGTRYINKRPMLSRFLAGKGLA